MFIFNFIFVGVWGGGGGLTLKLSCIRVNTVYVLAGTESIKVFLKKLHSNETKCKVSMP